MKLLISIALPLLAGFIGSEFTISKIPTWYAGLDKPFFSPPNWIFGPVWTTLYILMGIAFYLYWKTKVKKHLVRHKKIGIGVFGVQLFLNTLWSIVFFGMQDVSSAFIVILFLWAMIFMNILYFYKVNKTSAFLLLPYIAWVSFASLLNLSIWALN